MKKVLFMLAAVMLGLTACSTDDTEQPALQKVSVEMTVVPDTRAMAESRAVDESAIQDLNFYLVDKNGTTAVHLYQSSPMIRFECVPGDYRVRIIANVGRDLGEDADLDNLAIDYEDYYKTLPMACDEERSIVAGASSIELERCVAKVSYEISAVPEDIELKSVELVSIPAKYAPFASDKTPSADANDYTTTSQSLLTGREVSGIYYIFPNPQGTNPSITDQKYKNPENAPENATYFLIRASRNGEVLTYIVYLGVNNVTDFNVLANRHYRMKISLLGDNETDTRVIAYTLNVYDDFEKNYKYGDYCIYFPTSMLYVEIADNDSNMDLKGTYKVIEGEESSVTFNDFRGGSGPDFTMMSPNGLSFFGMQYHPQVYTRDNSHFAYQVTLRDDYGVCEDVLLEHDMANSIKVSVGDGGEVISSDALYCEQQNSGSTKQILALCYDEGCTLTATPDEYYQFMGWYADSKYTQKLSDNASYKFIPTEVNSNIFAHFAATGIELDANGKYANCYIAPKLNTGYVFTANRGNGTAAEAKVIWETGSVPSAVIKSVELINGKVYFTTGSAHGNAVIGVFDANEKCIWSWHIWAADYTPTGYTADNSMVFMDRNIGALSTNEEDPSSKGLFYQWGRKDPFVYPEIDEARSVSVSFLDGYKWTYLQNNTEGITAQWTIEHPTTVYSWQNNTYSADDTLWGNNTDGTAISLSNTKTDYDPCPYGWRVPEQTAWTTIAGFKVARFVADRGAYMYENADTENSTPYYPATGSIVAIASDGRFMYTNTGTVQYWTNTPYFLNINSNGSISYSLARRSDCHPVRCIRQYTSEEYHGRIKIHFDFDFTNELEYKVQDVYIYTESGQLLNHFNRPKRDFYIKLQPGKYAIATKAGFTSNKVTFEVKNEQTVTAYVSRDPSSLNEYISIR